MEKEIFIDTVIHQNKTKQLDMKLGIKILHLSLTKPYYNRINSFPKHNTIIITSCLPLHCKKIVKLLTKSAKLFCLGKNTAKLAKKLGFQDVTYANTNSQQLLNLLLSQKRQNKLNMPIIYPTTKNRVFDLDKKLAQEGIEVSTYDVYSLKENNKNILVFSNIINNYNKISIAIYSQKSAEIIEKVINSQIFRDKCNKSGKHIQFLALSKRVAQPIKELIPLKSESLSKVNFTLNIANYNLCNNLVEAINNF